LNYKKFLFLKLPYCPHPSSRVQEEDFRTRSSFQPLPSLALASLCAYIDRYKTLDYELRAIDLNIEGYTQPGVPIDESVYPGLLEAAIRDGEYDVLGLSAAFVFNARWVEDAVRLSRQHHPEAKIVLGGGYPTLLPDHALGSDCDVVVWGEGEAVFLWTLDDFNNYIGAHSEEQMFFVDGLNTFVNLPFLPPPAWHYLNVERFFERSGNQTLPIEGSRGCPYDCSYCSVGLAWGKKVRYKTVENLLEEIEQNVEKYGVKTVWFGDDNLAFNRAWFTKFLREFASRNVPVKLDASNFSVRHLDEEVVDLLIKAGFQRICVAVESGSQAIQEAIGKRLDFEQVSETVRMLKDKGLWVHLCWMVGFPGETLEQVRQTFRFARELGAHSNQFLTVLPLPGTRLFEEAQEAVLLRWDESDLGKFDCRATDHILSGEWTNEQLREMIYDANVEINFLENPLLKTADGRVRFLEHLRGLLARYPEHVVARIVVGWICWKAGLDMESEAEYQRAQQLLDDPRLARVFLKYTGLKSPVMKEFRRFVG